MENMKKYCAECIGTFVLVFMGCGSAMFLGCESNGGHLAVALAFGLSIVAMAYVIGGISGCHINPAVSLAMLLRKKISSTDFAGYVAAQIVGAIVAAGVLRLMLRFGMTDITTNLGSNATVGAGGIWGALLVEVILTFIFIIVILGVTSDEKKGSVAGIVIGLTLTFVHIVGIPLTGTSVNPARSIGPAIFAVSDPLSLTPSPLSEVWVFILGPLVGAAIAVFVYSLIAQKESEPVKVAQKPKAKAKKKKK